MHSGDTDMFKAAYYCNVSHFNFVFFPERGLHTKDVNVNIFIIHMGNGSILLFPASST